MMPPVPGLPAPLEDFFLSVSSSFSSPSPTSFFFIPFCFVYSLPQPTPSGFHLLPASLGVWLQKGCPVSMSSLSSSSMSPPSCSVAPPKSHAHGSPSGPNNWTHPPGGSPWTPCCKCWRHHKPSHLCVKSQWNRGLLFLPLKFKK